MLPKDLSLSQLVAFLAVADAGSISHAAHQLGISQPTLSRQIQALETVIGQPLFYRDVRPLVLSDAGQFLYQHTAKSISDLDTVVSLAQRYYYEQRDVLHIGFVASILYGRLPTIISQLKSTSPSLDVRLSEVSSYEQIDALKSGDIDVGFGRFIYDDAHIKQVFLCHEPYVAALPAHQRSHADRAISLAELAASPLILYHRTLRTLGDGTQIDPVLGLFSEQGYSPVRTQHTRDIQIALGLVAAGEGITLVPQSLSASRGDDLIFLPIYTPADTTPTSPIYLSMLAHRADERLTTLVDVAQQIYG